MSGENRETTTSRPVRERVSTLAAEPLLQLVAVMAAAALLATALRAGGGGEAASSAPPASPGAPPASEPARVVITQAEIEARLAREQASTGKPVSAARRGALTEQLAHDEVLVREARRLGLDRSDEVVRRRLVQMMELLLATAEPGSPPGDDALAAYLAAHPERFTRPARVSIHHVFVGRAAHPGDGEEVARALLARLRAGAEPAGLGDPFPRGGSFPLHSAAELDAIFGPLFGARVVELPEGRWSGPVASSFGLHLVRVDERAEAAVPPLAEVRGEVARALAEERAEAATKQAYAELAARYVIELPPGASAAP